MRAGILRHRIRLQKPFEVIDKGQAKTLWIDVGNFWAAVEQKSSSEPSTDSAVQGMSQFEVTMRYLDLDSKHRIIWNSKVLNLVGPPVVDTKKRQSICSCTCKEGQLPTADFFFQMTGGAEVGGENGV